MKTMQSPHTLYTVSALVTCYTCRTVFLLDGTVWFHGDYERVLAESVFLCPRIETGQQCVDRGRSRDGLLREKSTYFQEESGPEEGKRSEALRPVPEPR